MTHRGPCQPLPCWDSVILSNAAKGLCHKQSAVAQLRLPDVAGGHPLPPPPCVLLRTHGPSAHRTPGVGCGREGGCWHPVPPCQGWGGPAAGAQPGVPAAQAAQAGFVPRPRQPRRNGEALPGGRRRGTTSAQDFCQGRSEGPAAAPPPLPAGTRGTGYGIRRARRRAAPAPAARSCRAAGSARPQLPGQQDPQTHAFPLQPPANSGPLPEGGCHEKQETGYCICTMRLFNGQILQGNSSLWFYTGY